MPFAIRKRDTGEWLFKPRRGGAPSLVPTLNKATTWVGKQHAKACLHNLHVPELVNTDLDLVELAFAPTAIVEIIRLQPRAGSSWRHEIVQVDKPKRQGFRHADE